jgi:hypothetical protein
MLHAKVNGIIAELCRRKHSISSDVNNSNYQVKVRAIKSPKEYADDDGMHCPFCGSYVMTSEGLEIDTIEITQKITCLDCKKTWCDVYHLAGYKQI